MAATETAPVPQTYGQAHDILDEAPCTLPHHEMPKGIECNFIDLARNALDVAKRENVTYPEALAIVGTANLARLCEGCVIRTWIPNQDNQLNGE